MGVVTTTADGNLGQVTRRARLTDNYSDDRYEYQRGVCRRGSGSCVCYGETNRIAEKRKALNWQSVLGKVVPSKVSHLLVKRMRQGDLFFQEEAEVGHLSGWLDY